MNGYEGLIAIQRGRQPKTPKEAPIKKKEQPAELTPSEREEMIRLNAENEYLRTEIAAAKKKWP